MVSKGYPGQITVRGSMGVGVVYISRYAGVTRSSTEKTKKAISETRDRPMGTERKEILVFVREISENKWKIASSDEVREICLEIAGTYEGVIEACRKSGFVE